MTGVRMKKIEVVAALIEQGDRFLACQRPAGKARGLLWEFLGGKVEPGETREEAIVRECREEIGVTIAVHGIVAEVTHEYEELTVHLTLLRALISEGEPQALEHADIRFITIAEAEGYPFCAADQELLRIVREEKERKHMDHATKARELFCSGYNCAQAVAGAFAEDMGLPLETVTKLASGFGGGMGGMRETCGAVTGMFMVAGMMKGHALPANNEEKTAHYARIRALADAFKAEHDTLICRDLLASLPGKLDKNPSERTAEYYKTRPCALFVEDAARIVEKMLEE